MSRNDIVDTSRRNALKLLGASGATLVGAGGLTGSGVAATQLPIPVLHMEPAEFGVGTEVTLDASGSFDPAGEGIENYQWSVFHISNDYTLENGSFDESITFTFDGTGHWYVNLLVETPDGRTNDVRWFDTLHEQGDQWPIVRIGGTNEAIGEGDSVTLDAILGEPDADIDTYEWSIFRTWDDTTTYTGEQITHTFSGDGVRMVLLTATTPDGTKSYETDFVPIVGPDDQRPNVKFDAPTEPLVAGESYTFDGSASTDPDGGSITNYSWLLFKDNVDVDGSVDPTLSHTFSEPGDYRAVLQVWDDERQTATKQARFTVEEVVAIQGEPNWTAYPGPGIVYFEATLENLTSRTVTLDAVLDAPNVSNRSNGTDVTIDAGGTADVRLTLGVNPEETEVVFRVGSKEVAY